MAKTKQQGRREWTPEHIKQLRDMAKQGIPAPKAAKTLGRTVGATRQKAFSLGISLDSRRAQQTPQRKRKAA